MATATATATVDEVAATLRSSGFHLSEEFLAELREKEGESAQGVQSLLLKSDLRRQPCPLRPFFPADIATATTTMLTGPAVLQILSVCNASAPSKRRFEDNGGGSGGERVLSLSLSDGHSKALAVEIDRIDGLHAHTAPGAKLLFLGGPVLRGRLLLSQSNCRFLGGEVAHLLEAHRANLNALSFRALNASKKGKLALSMRSAAPPKFELRLLSNNNINNNNNTNNNAVNSSSGDAKTTAAAGNNELKNKEKSGGKDNKNNKKDSQSARQDNTEKKKEKNDSKDNNNNNNKKNAAENKDGLAVAAQEGKSRERKRGKQEREKEAVPETNRETAITTEAARESKEPEKVKERERDTERGRDKRERGRERPTEKKAERDTDTDALSASVQKLTLSHSETRGEDQRRERGAQKEKEVIKEARHALRADNHVSSSSGNRNNKNNKTTNAAPIASAPLPVPIRGEDNVERDARGDKAEEELRAPSRETERHAKTFEKRTKGEESERDRDRDRDRDREKGRGAGRERGRRGRERGDAESAAAHRAGANTLDLSAIISSAPIPTWTCKACTFANCLALPYCEICGTKK